MALSKWPNRPVPLTMVRVSTQQEFQDHVIRTQKERENRAKLEQTIRENTPSFSIPGFCFVCRRWTQFKSSWAWSYEFQGRKEINWREHLVCPSCGLNNRMRAAIHLLAEAGVSLKRSQIYATEQTTPLFARLRERCQRYSGLREQMNRCAHSIVKATRRADQVLSPVDLLATLKFIAPCPACF